jgi:predicted P-loop ATPase
MSKAEDTFFKSLMDKDLFSIREPYGRISVDLKRLAVVCGTSNTKEIILDPDNNRRIIPVDVNSIDFALYNSVDKGALFLELWDMYLAGYDYEMSFDDIQKLLESSECHNIISSEAELLHANFTKPASTMFAKQLTNSEILAFLKKETGAVLSPKRLGAVLKNSGFEQARVKKNGQVQRIYYVEYTRPVAEGLPH